MTLAEIDKMISRACQLYRRAVLVDNPEGDAAMYAYVEQRADIRAAISQHAREVN